MTALELRTGDLFAQGDVQALGHGVNCSGVMGRGVATEFRRRWPEMYRRYRLVCHVHDATRLRPGGVLPWLLPDGRAIYNLATQDRPGPHARSVWVREAVATMLQHAIEHGITSVALPRIGTGLGGLRWDEVRQVLTELAEPSAVHLIVVSLPASTADPH